MVEFKPDRWVGGAVGIALILLLLILDMLMVWGSVQIGISLLAFLLVLLILGSLLLIGLLAYWLYGLLWSGYYLDRNALVIRWGAATQVVPMGSVTAVLSGDQVKKLVRFRGPVWPGMRMGYGELQEIGPTLFYAAGPLNRMVILVTPVMAYALSPADRDAFLEAVRKRLSMGPTQTVEPMSRQPAWLTWSFWSDRPALALWGAALLLLLGLFGYLFVRYPALADLQPLHFNAAGQPDRWGTPAQTFTLPFIGLLALIANGGLGLLLYERERPASYLLWSGAVVVQILAWGATLNLLR